MLKKCFNSKTVKNVNKYSNLYFFDGNALRLYHQSK